MNNAPPGMYIASDGKAYPLESMPQGGGPGMGGPCGPGGPGGPGGMNGQSQGYYGAQPPMSHQNSDWSQQQQFNQQGQGQGQYPNGYMSGPGQQGGQPQQVYVEDKGKEGGPGCCTVFWGVCAGCCCLNMLFDC